MITLYIETNFFISFAKNQDQNYDDFVHFQYPNQISQKLKIITPSICCMESLSVLKSERRKSKRFQENLEAKISELKGSRNSQSSKDVQKCLEQTKIKNDARINDINIRLFEVLEWAGNNLELIQLEPPILIASLNQEYITDPTDNLILHCILNHAKTSSYDQKVLLSGNSKDFGTKEIKEILGAAGVQKYFANIADFLGWLQSI